MTPVWEITRIVFGKGFGEESLVLIHPTNGCIKEAFSSTEAYKCLEIFFHKGPKFTVCSMWAPPLKLIWEKGNFSA